MVLLALRQQDLQGVVWQKIDAIKNFHFIVLSTNVDLPNVTQIPEGTLPFIDVLNSCDLVLSKPGYSLISECLANQVKVLYIPREDFKEEIPLQKALQQDMVSKYLPLTDFINGEWQDHLVSLYNKTGLWKSVNPNGADFIAADLIQKQNALI